MGVLVTQLDARSQRDKARARTIDANWITLADEGEQLRLRIVAIAQAFDYAVVPAGLQALWASVPALERSIEDLGGTLYQVRTGLGPSIANRGQLPPARSLTADEADGHRQMMDGFRARLTEIGKAAGSLDQQAQAWLALAGRLAPAAQTALQGKANTRNVSQAIAAAPPKAREKKKPAPRIADLLAKADANLVAAAAMMLGAAPQEDQIKARLEGISEAYYKALGANSKEMMALNDDAGPAAIATVEALLLGNKFKAESIASIYRSGYDSAANRFSIAWRLGFDQASPQEKQVLSWLPSWELHAHCALVGTAPAAITGFTLIPGAVHVKPSLRQREVGESIDINAGAFVGTLQAGFQGAFVAWVNENPRLVQTKLRNFQIL